MHDGPGGPAARGQCDRGTRAEGQRRPVVHGEDGPAGRVVAITSISVRQTIANLILSTTARAGATGFLKTVAREVATDGVTVNSLQPGLHETERVSAVYQDGLADEVARIPTGVLGRPADFGALVAFLCSDRARYVTGADIPVDGGLDRALF